MSTINTTVEVDGKVIERDSIEAYRIYHQELTKLIAHLDEVNAIRPSRLHDDARKAHRALTDMRTRAAHVIEEFERDGSMEGALKEADWVEGKR